MFYRHLKQQRERNCWWKISTARQSFQSYFLAHDLGKVADPCSKILTIAKLPKWYI